MRNNPLKNLLAASSMAALAALVVACPTPSTTEDAGTGSSSGDVSSSSSSSGNASGGGSSGASGNVSSGGSSSGSSGRIIRMPNVDAPDNANRDSDCDGLTDAVEFGSAYAGGGHTDPGNPDSDGDGILDGVEAGATTIVAGDAAACGVFTGDQDAASRTDPTQRDSDGDGIPDGVEDANHNGRVDPDETDPKDLDSDGDGLPDGLEDTNHDGVRQPGETSAANRDTDADGIPDGVEDVNHDGMRQPTETDPRNPDTDGDGLLDGDEDRNWNHMLDTGETDPLVPDVDTDHDGIPDFRETQLGYDINNPDMDGDGLKDGEEDRNSNGVVDQGETNPRRADSDCDGLKDGEEDLNHNGTVDTNETDPLARDTDGDLLPDGLERGVTVNPDAMCPSFVADADPTSKTDPLKADTDNDGINDGIEDVNRNGRREATETDPNNADTDGDTLKDGNEDRNHNHVVDVGETDPLVADTDTDHDGLTDATEARLGTSPTNPDSDGDLIQDGVEDANHDGTTSVDETNPKSADSDCDGVGDGEEDANHNGVVDPGETDPRKPDSDNDGLTDGVELGRTTSPDAARCASTFIPAALPASMTNPLNPDSDGDGVPDGTEDGNHNGRVDPGEFDPKNPNDTGGVVNQACAIQNLTPITFHNTGNPPDIQLATLASFTRTPITVGGQPVGQYVMDNTSGIPVVGFSIARAPSGAELDANAVANTTRAQLTALGAGVLGNVITQSLPCTNPPNDCTWDGFPATVGIYDLNLAGDGAAAVSTLVNAILPGASALTGTLGSSGTFKLRMEFVRRSGQRAVIVGALMSQSVYNVDTTAYRLEDVTNGSPLAQVGDDTAVKCDTFRTVVYPKADIMLVIDNSGSMGASQNALSAAATAITTQLSQALLDWRVARITSDTDLPHNPCTGGGCALSPRRYGDVAGASAEDFEVWPFIQPASNSPADLMAASGVIETKLMKPGTLGWGREAAFNGLRMILNTNPDLGGTRHFLPASPAGTTDPWKLRADARFAVFIVTDASDQSTRTDLGEPNPFQDVPFVWTDGPTGTIQQFLRGGAGNGNNANSWDPNRTDELPIFMGGIFCPLGQFCNGEDDLHGDSAAWTQRYHDSVNALGGVIGNIQDTASISQMVAAYMTALIGNTSPYVLTQAPISASIKIAVDGQPVTGCNWANLPRSRVNGFDYDGATRKITFYGNCRPSGDAAQINKLVAVSYRYWVDRTSDPNGNMTPCGGACMAPLVCNPATNMCECPSSCGLANGCATPQVCDTNVAVCACTCPADCGGSPPNPRLQCNPATCAFTCPADCGGASPGPQFTCNQQACQYQCSACDPATRPSVNSTRWSCDLASCQWACPADCGGPSPGPGYRCSPLTCAWECTADCGGNCGGFETCSQNSCSCACQPTSTCGVGRRFDVAACDCVCDTAALNCGATRQADPNSCSCVCDVANNCGGACAANEICSPATCECIPVGG